MQTVAVARNNIRFGIEAFGQSAYEVVRLVARKFHPLYAHYVEHLFEHGHLRGKLIGHALSARLVAVEHLVPKSGRVNVERRNDIVGLYGVEHFHEHGGKPENRLHLLSLRIVERRQCVKRAVYKAVSVQKQ